MRTVILPPGSRRNAFNWFIDNINGHNQIEANNEFGVLDSAITQAALDQKLIDYAADLATVHSDYDTFLADTADEEFKKRDVDNNAGLTALIKVMVDELNTLRTIEGLPNLNFGPVNADVRSRAKKP